MPWHRTLQLANFNCKTPKSSQMLDGSTVQPGQHCHPAFASISTRSGMQLWPICEFLGHTRKLYPPCPAYVDTNSYYSGCEWCLKSTYLQKGEESPTSRVKINQSACPRVVVSCHWQKPQQLYKPHALFNLDTVNTLQFSPMMIKKPLLM